MHIMYYICTYMALYIVYHIIVAFATFIYLFIYRNAVQANTQYIHTYFCENIYIYICRYKGV